MTTRFASDSNHAQEPDISAVELAVCTRESLCESVPSYGDGLLWAQRDFFVLRIPNSRGQLRRASRDLVRLTIQPADAETIRIRRVREHLWGACQ